MSDILEPLINKVEQELKDPGEYNDRIHKLEILEDVLDNVTELLCRSVAYPNERVKYVLMIYTELIYCKEDVIWDEEDKDDILFNEALDIIDEISRIHDLADDLLWKYE